MAASSDFIDKEFRKFLDTNVEKASKLGKYVETLAAGDPLGMSINDKTNHPLLQRGDKCIINACTMDRICPGDIAFIRMGEKAVFRRVIRKLITKREVSLLVKAENSTTLDPPVRFGMLLGRLTSVERRGQKIGLGALRGSFWDRFTEFGMTHPGKKILKMLISMLPLKSLFRPKKGKAAGQAAKQ